MLQPFQRALSPRHTKPLAAILLTVSAGAMPTMAYADTYPTKAIRVIVPYGPGTAPDTVARIATDGLQKRLGQALIIENRTGAGGKLGTEAAATANADGYTLFLGTKDSQAILTHLYPTWSVKPDQALKPIAGLARIENVLVTGRSFGTQTFTQVLAVAKTKELTYGTPGVGTNLHLMGESLKAQTHTKLLHIPYSKSAAEALPATIRGDLDLLFSGLPPALPMLKDGRIKALAMTGTTRSKYLPNIPTFGELGVQGFESGGWFGLFAPAATPEPILKKLETAMTEVMKEPSYRERLEALSAEPWSATPVELTRTIEVESQRWGSLIREKKIGTD